MRLRGLNASVVTPGIVRKGDLATKLESLVAVSHAAGLFAE